MRTKSAVLFALTLLTGACAATYAPPLQPAQSASATVLANKAQILVAARRALVDSGFEITTSDDASGTISTAPKDQHVTPAEVNCGTTFGLDYLLDNRTDTQVSYGVIADRGRLEVRATVRGAYKPGAVDQNITLTCVSRGVLDNEMITKIRGRLDG